MRALYDLNGVRRWYDDSIDSIPDGAAKVAPTPAKVAKPEPVAEEKPAETVKAKIFKPMNKAKGTKKK
jgi:hypothetical protein